MKQSKLILAVALIGLSSAAMAATADRDQRMNEALDNYRSGQTSAKNPQPGPFARAEESTKRGVRKAGSAIKNGAKRVGQGISTGAEKTGNALRRTGNKMKGSPAPAN